MQDYQLRVIEEKWELAIRTHKLSQFIGLNPLFDNLPIHEQELMKEQCETMWQYYEILDKRTATFS